MTQSLIKSYIFFICSGWLDPAVRRDHEGKHQCEDGVRLPRLCEHLRLGFSHEKVRFDFMATVNRFMTQIYRLIFLPILVVNVCLRIPCRRCLEWLLNNLMTHQNVDLMKELGYNLCFAIFHFLRSPVNETQLMNVTCIMTP